ncbi:MAG TPA: hypothetical protein VGM03_09805 [Phycisphaerae bacterium]|jgi:hypothetical protein
MVTDIHDLAALPCPGCEYDLRAQADPRCPECGQTFASLEDLAHASRQAHRIYRRVLIYRVRVAAAIAIAILLVFGAALLGFYPLFWSPTALLLTGLIPLASSAAFVLLIQVIRWRFDRRIARPQRHELNGSVPILLIESIPFLLAVVPLAIWILFVIWSKLRFP